jgi:chromate transport protein ChrA
MAVVIYAVTRISRRALKNDVMVAIAVLAFIGIFFLNITFPLIVLTAGIIGFVGEKVRPDKFLVLEGHKAASTIAEEPEGCCDPRLRLNKTMKKTSRQVIEKYYSSTEDQHYPCRQASYRQGEDQDSIC